MIGLFATLAYIASVGGIGAAMSYRRDHRALRARINAYTLK